MPTLGGCWLCWRYGCGRFRHQHSPSCHPRRLADRQETGFAQKTTFAVHKRSFTRAAGVSPPWFDNAVANASVVPRLSTSACHGWLTPAAPGVALDGGTPIVAKVRLPRAIRFTATAGLRQPLLVHDAGPGKIATFAVHKRIFTRAAGVSPPCFGNAAADAIAFPGLSTSACHGWLTPIAPGARRPSAEK